MKITKEEKEEAKKKLLSWLTKGTKLYTILRHRSASGMTRRISVCTIIEGEIVTLDFWISRVLGWGMDADKGGLKVSGCGMDMGFHVVNSLAYALYSDGKAFNHHWL